jgi:ABC-type uncharacterized transport system permease subunit
MIEGITVLSTEVIRYAPVFVFLTVLAAIPLIIFICVLIGILRDRYYRDDGLICAALMLVMLAAAVFSFSFVSIFNQKDETVYKVIINDSVPLKEFQERYEIIEVEGIIYTIKEKQN